MGAGYACGRHRPLACPDSVRGVTYSDRVLALTVDTAKNVALIVLAGVLLVGFLVVKLMRSVTQKAISLVLTLGVVLGVWTQRANLSECADKVTAQATAGAVPSTTCTFFGTEVDLSLDALSN